MVSGIRVIKSFAQETQQSASFNRLSKRYELACNDVVKVDAAFHPVMDFSVALGSVVLLWFCTPEVMRGNVTLGTFVAFHEYIRRMVWPMSAIGMGVSMVQQGRASFDRIRELLATETDIPDIGDTDLGRFESVEVRNLSFTYPGSTREALKNINLTLRAGETIGLVGPVGAGKTTLLQLLSRLYPVESGKILINGVSLERVRRRSIAERISLVPQDAFLFTESISENVALGLMQFPGLESVEDAASIVNIDHEIKQMPHGYHAQLGERGVNLSGGQKQRLTIARALIRRSAVVMFDDSLSAVDGKTEQSIVRELKEGRARHPDQAVILVSHRLATLKHADRILVLNHGEIEAEGTHDELLVRSATYKRLHELQESSPEGADDSVWSIVDSEKSTEALK
jgi:ATP-binding cassette subfamily B protein